MSKKKPRLKPGWAWSAELGFHRTADAERKKLMNIPKPKPGSNEAGMLNDLMKLVNGISPDALSEDTLRRAGGCVDTPAVAYTPPAPTPEPAPVEDTQIFIENEWHAALSAPAPVKLFFTGRLGSGKDFLAAAAKCVVLGFADPLYAVASHYFDVEVTPTKNKDLPGMRTFLQTIGQWGRGTVSDKYPLTPARALFVQMIRADGFAPGFGSLPVDWPSYGRNENIWLDSLIARAAALPDARIAVTNCRFSNEYERLQKEGFEHWHVMCSPKSWAARLAKQKLTPDSPAVKDLSEQLAAKLDASVIQQCRVEPTGAPLKAIWSDEGAPPSPRLATVAGFLKTLGVTQ